MKRLCVIGSINMDLVVRVERFPSPGETLPGESFATYPGGKGANQAVAAARLGADVLMVGKVGGDLYGNRYLEVLRSEGVHAEAVAVERGSSTGVALIEVDRSSENRIVIVPGANAFVTPAYLESIDTLIDACDLFLLQLEIPLSTVVAACDRLRASGKTIILDPAPAAPLPDSLLASIDLLTPNEHELAALSGVGEGGEEAIAEGVRRLTARGARTVVVKAGRAGAYIAGADDRRDSGLAEGAGRAPSDVGPDRPASDGVRGPLLRVPGYEVPVVDTTAAGDSFNAGLACALAEGYALRDAVAFANAVGALATTGMGAQGAMPTRAAVKRFVAAHPPT